MKKLKETTPNMVNLPHKSCKLLLIKILITIGNNNNKSNFNNNNNNNNNDNNNNNNGIFATLRRAFQPHSEIKIQKTFRNTAWF